MTRKLLTRALFCGILAVVSAFADVTIGLPPDTNSGNCFPFGCAYSGEYQQVYTSRAFSGPILINDLEFFNTAVNFGATQMNSGTWTISLSTTSADWNTLSPIYGDNIGANNTQVFSGDLFQPWTFGDTLHISLSTPFLYDPSNGNLLMDVFVSGASAAGGEIFFDTNGYDNDRLDGNTIMGRVYTTGNVNKGYGLVTGFSTVPEPAPTLLITAGLAIVAAAFKRAGQHRIEPLSLIRCGCPSCQYANANRLKNPG